MKNQDEIVQAILDLTRVTIAIGGGVSTRAEAVRKLSEFAIPPARIAAILAMDTKDVTSTLTKAKKRKARRN